MTVRKLIIDELRTGVKDKALIIKRVQEVTGVTVQAIYKELRNLVVSEQVIDKNKKLSLTISFVEDKYKKWKEAHDTYTDRISPYDFLQLSKEQARTFTFSNLVDLDLFWTQAFVMLERILPDSIPTYSIIPHDWFYYARAMSDEVWTKSKTRLQRLLITHPTELDWEIARQRRHQGYEFTGGENPLKLSERQYCTIVSDWIFEVDFDPSINEDLVTFIKKQKNITSIDSSKLDAILKKKGKFKMKVFHSPKKAAEYTKKINRYFS